MSRGLPRQHVQLDFSTLDDADRLKLAVQIAEVAPSSEIYQANPAIQAAVASVAARATALQTSNETVAGDRAQLLRDIGVETTARTALDGAILTLARMTEVNATSPGDLVTMAFTPRDNTRSFLLTPPDQIDISFPSRGHGKAYVTAHEPDKKRRHYQVETCPFGSDTWTALVGWSKKRTLKGPSGSQLWVRYATVRGQAISAWCTAVLVTFP